MFGVAGLLSIFALSLFLIPSPALRRLSSISVLPAATMPRFALSLLFPFALLSSTLTAPSLSRGLVSREFQNETQTLRFSTRRWGTKKTRWPRWCRQPRDRSGSTHIDIDQLFVRTAAVSTSFPCASCIPAFERIYVEGRHRRRASLGRLDYLVEIRNARSRKICGTNSRDRPIVSR